MLIYLITHPATKVEKTNPNKWKISREGWKQVKNLAKKRFWNDVEFIFASTERKANNAAEYWSKKYKIPMKIVKGIEEVNNRKYLPEKELWKNIDLFFAEPSRNARGWETANHCKERMINTMNKIIKKARKKHCKAIAIVSHGVVANLYICNFKKIRANFSTGQKKIGSWIIIDAEKKKVLSSWQTY